MDTIVSKLITVDAKTLVILGFLVCLFEFFVGTIYLIDTFVSWYYGIKQWRRCMKARREIKKKYN